MMLQVIPVDTDLSAPFHAQNEMDCLFIRIYHNSNVIRIH
jgi:hypothetical protein